MTAYEVNADVFSLPGKRFSLIPELEWLEFICSNRRMGLPGSVQSEPRHGYHWVSGPIADDKVVDVVSEYMREEVSADVAIDRLRVLPQTYQISLHSASALSYVDDVNMMYRQLKRGRWTQNWIKL